MRNMLIAAAALAGLTLAAPAMAREPAKGESVTSTVEIGKLRVALPPGKWNVVAEQTGKASSSDGIPTGGTTKSYFLVQYDEAKRFVGSFHIRATTEAGNPIEWRDKTCGREDTLYRVVLGGPTHSQNCVLMNHLVRYFQAQPRDLTEREAWKWMQAQEVQVPKTVLQVQERFFKGSEYLWVDYTVNPELVDFVPSTVTDWRGSEWHPDFVKTDPERQEYIEHVKKWALSNAKVHQAALDQGRTGEIAPYPR